MTRKKILVAVLAAALVVAAATYLIGAVGDVTYTVRYRDGSFASGTVEADSNGVTNVCIGFQPSRIEIYVNDADERHDDGTIIWQSSMGAGYFQSKADSSWYRSAGGLLAVYAGAADSAEGFTITATGLGLEDSDILHWCAWR